MPHKRLEEVIGMVACDVDEPIYVVERVYDLLVKVETECDAAVMVRDGGLIVGMLDAEDQLPPEIYDKVVEYYDDIVAILPVLGSSQTPDAFTSDEIRLIPAPAPPSMVSCLE